MPYLRTSIETYFHGERVEMIAFLAFAAVLIIASIVLWTTRDAFARPLAIVLFASALVSCSTAIPLLLRDGPNKQALLQQLEQGNARAMSDELARMEAVVRNYPYYRYLFVAAILAAAVMALFFRNATTLGVGVGLLVFGATGFVVDHYSQQRAEVYIEQLKSA